MLELRPFSQSGVEMTRLNSALQLYRKLIPIEARNPEEQIIYWIDNGKERLTDEFVCLSIHRNDKVVGYFQYSYFVDEHMFFLEYLCLSAPKKGSIFSRDCLLALKQHLASHYRPGFTILFEAVQNKHSHGWVPDQKRLKYYEFFGFRRVECEYRYPVLQSYGEQTYPADLMVHLPGDRETISISELRTMLRAIYFKHYLRWDKPFLTEEQFCRREEMINRLYAEQLARFGNKDDFATSGTKRASTIAQWQSVLPQILPLMKQVFGQHHFFRLAAISLLFLLVRHVLHNDIFFIPFILVMFAAWCLIDEKESSRKLFGAILVHITRVRPRR